MPGTILSSRDTSVNKTDMVSSLDLMVGEGNDWRKRQYLSAEISKAGEAMWA